MLVPRPFRDGGLFAALLALVGAAWRAGLASWIVSAAFIGVLTVIALQRVIHDRRELVRCRRLADRLIAGHPGGELLLDEISPLAAWRAAELTSERHRRSLARALRRLLDDPVGGNEHALFLLRRLEQRVADISRPVGAQGILLVTEVVERRVGGPQLFDTLGEALVFLEEPSTG